MSHEVHQIHSLRGSLSGLRRPEFKLSRVASGQAPSASAERPSRVQDSYVLSQLELFEAINLAAAVVNRDEHIVRLNRRCGRVLGSSLSLQRERFVAQHRRSNERLRKAMQAVFSDHDASQSDALQGVIMSDSEPPIVFRAFPLGRSYWDGRPLYALLVFCSAQLQSPPDAGLLSRAFALTPAQARVACHLATGARLDTVAAQLGVKKETVRNHLKQIFLRTGTCRQGELVARLSAFWLGAQKDGKEAAEEDDTSQIIPMRFRPKRR